MATIKHMNGTDKIRNSRNMCHTLYVKSDSFLFIPLVKLCCKLYEYFYLLPNPHHPPMHTPISYGIWFMLGHCN